MADLIYKVKGEGDTIGGTLTCVIKGCPIGLGQPVFGKLHAALGNAMLSINAAKAFEYGDGFKGLKQKGSEQNDVSSITADVLKRKPITPAVFKAASATDRISSSALHSSL